MFREHTYRAAIQAGMVEQTVVSRVGQLYPSSMNRVCAATVLVQVSTVVVLYVPNSAVGMWFTSFSPQVGLSLHVTNWTIHVYILFVDPH